jgi:hypothetical protein
MKTGTPLHIDKTNVGININCYCFNPACSASILNVKKFSPVIMPLSKVLTERVCCQECGEELISTPLLEIKSLSYNSNRNRVPADVT